VHVIAAESTELFVGLSDAPLQLVRVSYTADGAEVRVEGDGLDGEALAETGTVEVSVTVSRPVVGERRDADVRPTDGPATSTSSGPRPAAHSTGSGAGR
jgi:hypothetical protein